MKATEGTVGRVFVLRLEDGDVVPHCIERFAREKGIRIGQAVLIGGLDKGEVVVGPRDSNRMPPDPMMLPLDGSHEVCAVGVLAPDEAGNPVLHMHGALGRSGQTVTGCLRQGIRTWVVGEVVLYEILGAAATRVKDAATGFSLLMPKPA